MKVRKNIILIVLSVFSLFFSSCLIFNANKTLTVDKAEFIDSTHFTLYCLGYGLPADKYIIISNEYAYDAKTTHTVISSEPVYSLFISIGAVTDCEVSPSFEAGEKVVVWIDSPFEETYGYAEFTVPDDLE